MLPVPSVWGGWAAFEWVDSAGSGQYRRGCQSPLLTDRIWYRQRLAPRLEDIAELPLQLLRSASNPWSRDCLHRNDVVCEELPHNPCTPCACGEDLDRRSFSTLRVLIGEEY